MEETITCTVFNLQDEGLVSIREIPGDHLVGITETGQNVLTRATAIGVKG